MKVSLFLFLLGLSLVIMGYTNQISQPCSQQTQVRYVPRHVYDELHHQNPDHSSITHRRGK